LVVRNLYAFMSFDVRPQRNAEGVRAFLHSGQIPLEYTLIEQECRGRELENGSWWSHRDGHSDGVVSEMIALKSFARSPLCA
jgi:hypothetical protein